MFVQLNQIDIFPPHKGLLEAVAILGQRRRVLGGHVFGKKILTEKLTLSEYSVPKAAAPRHERRKPLQSPSGTMAHPRRLLRLHAYTWGIPQDPNNTKSCFHTTLKSCEKSKVKSQKLKGF